MTRAQHHGTSSGDRSDVPADGARGYDVLRRALADDIDALETEGPISTARLVGDLSANIKDAVERGVTFAALAKAFERRGVTATSEAVRVAFGRERKRQSEQQPALDRVKRRQATAPLPPTAPPPEVDDGTRAGTSGADSEPARETHLTPLRVGVGRHLD